MNSMRNSTRRKGRRLQNDINVVPYIDVMLVLLVIFMVTAPMITPGLIDLPTVGTASEVPVEPVEVQINENGEISMRVRSAGATFQAIDPQNLLPEVQARITQDTPVVIAADGKVPYESVLKVMDQLRNGGVTKLGLLVNQGATSQSK
ncbi:ExbD/TolR family protein [Alcaligenaceae bacterium CGII-47]|nr:ExbD/TolR family protein [Alcaligenaceae bacterium CGII-47]